MLLVFLFLCQGGYAGNALGFKINSLTKLMDTRANKPRMTLLHVLVADAEKEAEDVLEFAPELLPVLAEASRLVLKFLPCFYKMILNVSHFS